MARLYSQVFINARSTHTVEYVKGANGRYYARRSIAQSQSAGRVLGKQRFYYQTICEQFLRPLPEAGPAPVKAAKSEQPAPVEVPYRPEFWESYQRPEGLAKP